MLAALRFAQSFHPAILPKPISPLSRLLSYSSSSDLSTLSTLSAQILHHDTLYYEESSPTISDFEYDALVAEEREFCLKHPDILRQLEQSSPLKKQVTRFGGRIGPGSTPTATTTLARVSHLSSSPMLSLDNAMTSQHLSDWLSRVRKNLNSTEPLTIVCEPKLDGLSLSLRYAYDQPTNMYNFERAASRGDGSQGDDVTTQASHISSIPRRFTPLPTTTTPPAHIEIRGEVVLPLAAFSAMNAPDSPTPSLNYTNCRNAASGILRRRKSLDSTDADLQSQLHFYAYDVTHPTLFSDSHAALITSLKGAHFSTCEPTSLVTLTDTSLAPVLDYFDRLTSSRALLPFEVDGAVYKLDSAAARLLAGASSRAPRFAIAHKFGTISALTTLTGIETRVGRTGAITPVAILAPVDVGGVTVSRASLHNFVFLKDIFGGTDIASNSQVEVERAGDVIPQVKRKVDPPGDGSLIDLRAPKFCPACGAGTLFEWSEEDSNDDSGQVLRCTNSRLKCRPQMLGALSHAVSRTALDVPGLSEKKLGQLADEKLVERLGDLFELDLARIEALPGWGAKSVENLKAAMESVRTKGVALDRVIYALGVRHVGKHASKLFAAEIGGDVEIWKQAVRAKEVRERFQEVKGVGETMIRSLEQFCEDEEAVADLMRVLEHVQVEEGGGRGVEGGAFEGLSVVFTGALEGMTRDQAQEWALKLGASATPSSLSKKTGLLVVGEGGGGKRKKAEELGVKVMGWAEFEELIKLP